MSWKMPDEASDEGPVDPFAVPPAEEVKVDWKGDWVVWNSRSGMIVARGSWRDVALAERVLGFEELPVVIRTHVEVKRGAKSRSLSLISRSSEKASMQMGDLCAEVEALIVTRAAVAIEVPFRLNWISDENRGKWEVNTAISMREGQSYKLGRHGMGDRGWEVMVSAERETPEGIPWKELRQMETPRGVQLWSGHAPVGEPVRKKLAGDRWLGVYPIAPDFISNLLAEERFSSDREIALPAELAEWAPQMLIDMRPMLEEWGVNLSKEGSMAALDPLTSTIFIIADKENQEMAESLLQPACVMAGSPIWIETNPESGNWGVASRSGEKTEIRRASSDPGNQLQFLSEPTQGSNGAVFDLRYTIDVVSGDAKIGTIESATTLNNGKPQVIGSGVTSDGKEVKVTVVASNLSP
ncbi:MAG TPA: hypothetical protein VGE67_11010 [Haloferula sp.]